MNRDNLQRKTINDFGEQWTMYRDNDGYYGSVELLADIVQPLLPVVEIEGKKVAEIGSGTGRLVNMLLAAGASHVVALEPSAAFEVLRRNVESADQVTFIQDTGDRLPPYGDIDIVLSIGVLHHIPDPAPAVAAAFRALRPGGKCLVWLYGKEGNQPYLLLAAPLRLITTRLPHKILAGLAYFLDLLLMPYIGMCRMLPLPMHSYMTRVLGKLSAGKRRLVIYDQLNPAYAKYYTRSEAEELLVRAGFVNVASHHRHGYSWSVLGIKPRDQESK